MAYPPPLPHRRAGTVDELGDETALHEAATLYATSPHVHVDDRERARRARRAQYGRRSLLYWGPASQISPTWLLSLVLVLGVLWVLWSRPGPARVAGPPAEGAPPPSIPVCAPRMPAQKTFTLSSRSKGCHLVQDEVEREVRDMLRGVQVGLLTLFLQHTSAALSLNENFDRDVRTDMDMVRGCADAGDGPHCARVAAMAAHGRGPRRLGVALQVVADRSLGHDPDHEWAHEPGHLAGRGT